LLIGSSIVWTSKRYDPHRFDGCTGVAPFSRGDIPQGETRMAATKFPVKADCPTCGDLMHVTGLECDSCGTSVEGNFFLHKMNRLPTQSLAFLESFIKNKGVTKDIEVDLGISDPTVKARLDEVVSQLGYAGRSRLRPS